LTEKLENLRVVKRASRHFIFDDCGSDGSNGSHDDETSMAATD
jgi:hypothetical protein